MVDVIKPKTGSRSATSVVPFGDKRNADTRTKLVQTAPAKSVINNELLPFYMCHSMTMSFTRCNKKGVFLSHFHVYYTQEFLLTRVRQAEMRSLTNMIIARWFD